MSTTPQFGLPLPPDGQRPWGEDYRSTIMAVDARLLSVRGSFFSEDNTDPTVSPGTEGAKAVLGTVTSGPPCGFCEIDGNRLTYTGTLTKVPTVFVTANVETAANTTVQIQIRKNGERVPGAAKKIRLNAGQPLGLGAISANIELEQGDFLEVWVANLTGAQDVIVQDVTLVTRG